MKRGAPWLGAFSGLTYVFLYAPILVLVVFSFNSGRLTARWEGFTLEWYANLIANPQIVASLRNSLLVAGVTTLVSTLLGTAAALAFFRHRFKREAALDGLITLPIVVPEIVLASSLVLLFAAIGLRLGFLTVILAHVAFSVSYAVVVVKARLAGIDRSLEEAAMDLGATPLATFWLVTLPRIAPGVLAAALLVFSLSIDDYVITSFVAGVGATTLPIQIYSMVRTGITPEINAISSVLLVATSLLLYSSWRLERGHGTRQAAPAALLGLALLGWPFLVAGAPRDAERTLNLYIWSNYIAPDTVRKFEQRFGVKVNVDLYDTNEAMLAKIQSGNVGYDLLCPSNYPIQALLKQDLLLPLDHSALPHLRNLDPRFLDLAYDRGNRYSVPYFWGTAGIAYDRRRVPKVDSWAALWDPAYRGRILMLDDPRESLGAALKWKGLGFNSTGRAALDLAVGLLLEQKPLVRTYNASNFEDVLLAGDVWLAHGWNGQFARAMEQSPHLEYVIPKEGGSFFIDSLVIPRSAPHPELAHAFIDFVMEAEIAAEICVTMQYSTPNRAAMPLLPERLRANRAVFPSDAEVARLELIEDIGEATVDFDRAWTEVKTR